MNRLEAAGGWRLEAGRRGGFDDVLCRHLDETQSFASMFLRIILEWLKGFFVQLPASSALVVFWRYGHES